MSEVAFPPASRDSVLSRAVQFAVFFAMVGPPIGAVCVFAISAVHVFLEGRPNDLLKAVASPVFFAGLGVAAYVVGSAPAFVTGCVVGAMSRWIRGRGLYLVGLGVGMASFLPLTAVGFGWNFPLQLGGLGAVAALACTEMARALNLGRLP